MITWEVVMKIKLCAVDGGNNADSRSTDFSARMICYNELTI
jgi:hypothetical protein